jgi:hypothetical protein
MFVVFLTAALTGRRMIVRMARKATYTRCIVSLTLATIIGNACAGPIQQLDIATVLNKGEDNSTGLVYDLSYKYALGCASGSDSDNWVRVAQQCNLHYGFHCDNEGQMKHRKDNMVCQKSCGCHKLRAHEVSQSSDGQ